MGHAQQGAAITVEQIDLHKTRSRRHVVASLPAEAVSEAMDRHDLAEGSAGRAAVVADALDEVEPARLRLGDGLMAHPAHDLVGIGEVSEDRGGWGRDLRLAPDYERFSHRNSPRLRAMPGRRRSAQYQC